MAGIPTEAGYIQQIGEIGRIAARAESLPVGITRRSLGGHTTDVDLSPVGAISTRRIFGLPFVTTFTTEHGNLGVNTIPTLQVADTLLTVAEETLSSR